MLILIACFCLASWGVYVYIPNRGAAGIFLSAMTVAGLLSLVYLVKWVILT